MCPSVLRLPSGAIVAHWLQKSAASTYAYDVRLSYSIDDGKTWSPSFLPHHDGTPTEHGFASLFPMGDGFGLVWLDGRAMKPAASHGEHGGGGAMSVRFARFDKNFKQVEESVVDAKVCECCPTTAAVTAEGVITAYRNRSDDEIRDNYVARLVNGKWTDAAAGVQRQLEDRRVPGERPVAQRQRQRRRDDVVHRQERTGPGLCRVLAGCGQDVRARRFASTMAASLGRVDLEMLPDGSALATWIEFAQTRKRTRTVPGAPHRTQRHALGAGHDRRHRRLALERLSARRGRQRRSGVRLDRIRRRRRLAGPHRGVAALPQMKTLLRSRAPGFAFLRWSDRAA